MVSIVSNGYNIVPAWQRNVALKIVVANRRVHTHLKVESHQIGVHIINRRGIAFRVGTKRYPVSGMNRT